MNLAALLISSAELAYIADVLGPTLVQLVLLSQQPEEQLPVLPIPNTVELPTQIMGWKSTFISETTPFQSFTLFTFSGLLPTTMEQPQVCR